jgi:hypothetical protein
VAESGPPSQGAAREAGGELVSDLMEPGQGWEDSNDDLSAEPTNIVRAGKVLERAREIWKVEAQAGRTNLRDEAAEEEARHEEEEKHERRTKTDRALKITLVVLVVLAVGLAALIGVKIASRSSASAVEVQAM